MTLAVHQAFATPQKDPNLFLKICSNAPNVLCFTAAAPNLQHPISSSLLQHPICSTQCALLCCCSTQFAAPNVLFFAAAAPNLQHPICSSLQLLEARLSSIYTRVRQRRLALVNSLLKARGLTAAIIGLGQAATSPEASLMVPSGCSRFSRGSLRVQFHVNGSSMSAGENLQGGSGSEQGPGRRLRSTPCSATGGTSVRLLAGAYLHVACLRVTQGSGKEGQTLRGWQRGWGWEGVAKWPRGNEGASGACSERQGTLTGLASGQGESLAHFVQRRHDNSGGPLQALAVRLLLHTLRLLSCNCILMITQEVKSANAQACLIWW